MRWEALAQSEADYGAGGSQIATNHACSFGGGLVRDSIDFYHICIDRQRYISSPLSEQDDVAGGNVVAAVELCLDMNRDAVGTAVEVSGRYSSGTAC